MFTLVSHIPFAQQYAPVQTLTGHDGSITALAASYLRGGVQQGQATRPALIASASADSSVKIWVRDEHSGENCTLHVLVVLFPQHLWCMAHIGIVYIVHLQLTCTIHTGRNTAVNNKHMKVPEMLIMTNALHIRISLHTYTLNILDYEWNTHSVMHTKCPVCNGHYYSRQVAFCNYD